ncbi:YicC family protein [Candidatus Acetothermia bacterium]|nr:MAG: YicC family protein [Candidatus Acetothermia bacterium]
MRRSRFSGEKMIKSMTGFGEGVAREAGWRVEATIRTLNHRFLSVRARSLGDRPWLQAQVEDLVKRSFNRGEVTVWLDLQSDSPEDGRLFDHKAALSAYRELRELSEELSLPPPPSLEALIRVGALQPAKESDREIWPAAKAALAEAIEAANASRTAEGAALAEELDRILDRLKEIASSVKPRIPELADRLRDRLRSRAEELALKLDPDRLEAEIALLVERYDVQEELTRLDGHLRRARILITGEEPVGKELDFISQEMLREVNTLGSKARDSEIGGLVIDMKLGIERFREQVQNVE